MRQTAQWALKNAMAVFSCHVYLTIYQIAQMDNLRGCIHKAKSTMYISKLVDLWAIKQI